MTATTMTLADLQRRADADAPDLADAIIAFAEADLPERDTPLPEGAIDPAELNGRLAGARAAAPSKRGALERALWRAFLDNPDAPPPERYLLGDFLVKLYEGGRESHREVLIDLALRAPLKYGLWAGFKRIYKRAEALHDARIWGALSARFDLLSVRYGDEVSNGTLIYLRRRAWRWLSRLAKALPAMGPHFSVEVLRHIPEGARFQTTWFGMHVVAARSGGFGRRRYEGPLPANLIKHRAFDAAWAGAPDALTRLLEAASHDVVARFAIQSLRKDAPERLRAADPAWLARLGRKPLESVHEFILETIDGSPSLHRAKLRALGLHETALSLLASPSKKARAWAIEYGRAHARDMGVDEILDRTILPEHEDAQAFGLELLQARPARDIGLPALGRMLTLDATRELATKLLNEGFAPADFSRDFLLSMAFGEYAQLEWLSEWFNKRLTRAERDPALWIAALSDPRAIEPARWGLRNAGLDALDGIGAENLPTPWLLDALANPHYASHVAEWIAKLDRLPGLDVERVKGLVFNPQLRGAALSVLGHRKLVGTPQLGLGWLLALARRSDPTLRDFALRTLLESSRPEDFADGEKTGGVARLFKMALVDKDEPVRAFAQRYLRCHHPEIGREQPESKQYGIKPQLAPSDFTLARVWPFFASPHEDARAFALAVARADLRRWGAIDRLFALAEHEDAPVRRFALDALLRAGDADGPAQSTPTLDELDPGRVFSLCESRRRGTRDAGMALILKHYARLGGPEKLGRIMESPDRDVRQFAVRLLWERHRPRDLPPGWTPRGRGSAPDTSARFQDIGALRDFLRRLLFGLPPGRAGEPLERAATRHIPASVAKRNVIDVVRDLGLEDEAFARVVAPVLREFTGSTARGEWQACLAALVRLRGAHPSIELQG